MTSRLSLSPEQERIVRGMLSTRLPTGIGARAFGSRVWGDPKPYSDLDIALNGAQRIGLSMFADLADAFSDSDLPFKVDLSDWRALGSALQTAVDREGVELAQNASRGGPPAR